MIKRKALERLSTQQLERYIKEDSRFLPEAIDLAVQVLKERGRTFSEEELKTIEQLKLKNIEPEYNTEEVDLFYEHNTVQDPDAISLYPLSWIIIGTTLLTTLFGSILLAFNLIKLKKYTGAFTVLVLGLGYLLIQNNLTELFVDLGVKKQGRYSATPSFLSALVGSFIMWLLWLQFIPNTLLYRSKNLWFPLLLALLSSTLIYFDILENNILEASKLFYNSMRLPK